MIGRSWVTQHLLGSLERRDGASVSRVARLRCRRRRESRARSPVAWARKIARLRQVARARRCSRSAGCLERRLVALLEADAAEHDVAAAALGSPPARGSSCGAAHQLGIAAGTLEVAGAQPQVGQAHVHEHVVGGRAAELPQVGEGLLEVGGRTLGVAVEGTQLAAEVSTAARPQWSPRPPTRRGRARRRPASPRCRPRSRRRRPASSGWRRATTGRRASGARSISCAARSRSSAKNSSSGRSSATRWCSSLDRREPVSELRSGLPGGPAPRRRAAGWRTRPMELTRCIASATG